MSWSIAVQKLHDFIWDEFCDWYIEMVKPRLSDDKSNKPQQVLVYVLSQTLKLLHPFMPFITEKFTTICRLNREVLWFQNTLYMMKNSPSQKEQQLELIKNAIRAIRNLRAEMNVPPSKKQD